MCKLPKINTKVPSCIQMNFHQNPDGPANDTRSNIGAVVYNNDERHKGEFLIMTRKEEEEEEEEVGFNNNRSIPHWNNLYSNEASIGHFHGTTKILIMI